MGLLGTGETSAGRDGNDDVPVQDATRAVWGGRVRTCGLSVGVGTGLGWARFGVRLPLAEAFPVRPPGRVWLESS